jgi:hypothetical protein
MWLSFLIMSVDTYKQALDAARKDMSRLVRDREEIDNEILNLENAINSLAKLCEEALAKLPYPQESEAFAVNLRDAIRLILNMARPNALSPTEVRDKLRENGFRLDRYKYELPPIHNTIGRLEAAGEIELAPRPDGEKAYKFVSSFKRAMHASEPRIHLADLIREHHECEQAFPPPAPGQAFGDVPGEGGESLEPLPKPPRHPFNVGAFVEEKKK